MVGNYIKFSCNRPVASKQLHLLVSRFVFQFFAHKVRPNPWVDPVYIHLWIRGILSQWHIVVSASCALLGRFTISARVSLLWRHSRNAKCQRVLAPCLVSSQWPCQLDVDIDFYRVPMHPWKYLNFFSEIQGLESTWKQGRCLKVLEFHWIGPWVHQVKLRDIRNFVKQHLYRTGMHILSICQVFCLNEDLLIIVVVCFYQLKLYRDHTNRY